MKTTLKNLSRTQDNIVSEVVERHRKTGEPIALNQLPLWRNLTKSEKIKLGRWFKKRVFAGEVEGIKFVAKRADNHSTYMPYHKGGLLRKLFG